MGKEQEMEEQRVLGGRYLLKDKVEIGRAHV